jgi:hypothetical protein
MSGMIVKLKCLVLNDTPKCRNWLSKMAHKTHKTHKTHRTQISKTVVLNEAPKCRSRTVVRFVMLAAWARTGVQNGKDRSQKIAPAERHINSLKNP